MKKSILILLAASSTLLFTGCGQPEERIEPTESSAITHIETTAQTAETAAEESSVTADAESSYQVYQGAILSITEDSSSLTLQDTGIQDPVTISLISADLEISTALAAELEITAICNGDKAIVIADIQATPPVISQIQGSVTSQAMSTFSVTAEDGTHYDFLKNNTEGLTADVLGTSMNDSNGTDAIVKVTYVQLSAGDGGAMLIPLRTQRVS